MGNASEVSQENQQRMQMDLYEVMLLRMGMAVSREGLVDLVQGQPGAEEGDQAGCRPS